MKSKKTLKLFFWIFVLIFININVVKADFDLQKAQNILVSTAMDYKYRDKAFQYDDQNVVYRYSSQLISGASEGSTDIYDYKQWRVPRITCGFSPEEATPQNRMYASCSPFLLNVYYEAFNGYTIHYINNNQEYPTSNSHHFIFMADPSKPNYYNANVAEYNIVVKNTSGNSTWRALDEAYALGLNIIETTKNNTSGKVIYDGACEHNGDCVASTYDDLKTYIRNTIYNTIQVGDIIGYTYRGESGSHVMMCISKENGNAQFIHSFNGSSYVYDQKRDYLSSHGTVAIWDLDYLLNGEGNSSALFKSKEYTLDNGTTATYCFVSQISIIRPLNEIQNDARYNQTSISSQARYDHPDLVRMKTASVTSYESVNPGDPITYTISLTNKSTTDTYGSSKNPISVTDKIPNNTIFISCTNNCKRSGNSISWSINSIAPSSKVELSFTVKVKNSTSYRTVITSDKTVADNIKLNTITTAVNKTLSDAYQDNLIDGAKALIGEEYSASRYFIQDVYDSLGISWFNYGNVSSSNILLNYFYTKNTDGAVEIVEENGQKVVNKVNVYMFDRLNNLTYSQMNNYQKMYVQGLYGGRYTPTTDPLPRSEYSNAYCLNRNDRNKFYDKNTLMIGDVLVLYDKDYETERDAYLNETDENTKKGLIQVSSLYDMYLYLGNGEFITVPQYSKKVTVFNNLFPSSIDTSNRYRLLESLLGQTAFVILRPSYVITSDVGDVIGDVNADGVFSKKDAHILASSVVTNNFSDRVLIKGDINDDEAVKMNDIVKILKLS